MAPGGSRQSYEHGDLVWATVSGYPRWPGQVFPHSSARSWQHVCSLPASDKLAVWWLPTPCDVQQASKQASKQALSTRALLCLGMLFRLSRSQQVARLRTFSCQPYRHSVLRVRCCCCADNGPPPGPSCSPEAQGSIQAPDRLLWRRLLPVADGQPAGALPQRLRALA